MYKIEKRFTFPMGHRLSKHKGLCRSVHGHNFTILVGIKSKVLDSNDMVIDFSNLKNIVSNLLKGLDHCMLLNEKDKELEKVLEKLQCRVMTVAYDPTAERLAETLYKTLEDLFLQTHKNIMMDYITVYENETSKATYVADEK